MAKEFKEKTITINLRKVFQKPATKRAISAKNMLKAAVTKETRLKETTISNKLNELIWGRGKYKTPRIITVKVINEKGRGVILLPEEKYEPKQDKKTAKEAKPTTTPKAANPAEEKTTKEAPKTTAAKDTKTATEKAKTTTAKKQ